MTVKKRIIIKGDKVHNIGYRPFLMEKAQELKILNFHAKDIKEDGKQVVDVRVGGEGTKIDNFLKFVDKNLPEHAEVESISVEEYEGDIMTLKEFSRVFSASQLSKIVQTGIGMLDKQDKTIEVLGAKIDNHAKKTEDGFSKTDQNFAILRDDYGKISKDLTKAIQGIEQVAKNTEKLLEKSEEDRGEFRDSINKLANAILKLAEKTG